MYRKYCGRHVEVLYVQLHWGCKIYLFYKCYVVKLFKNSVPPWNKR